MRVTEKHKGVLIGVLTGTLFPLIAIVVDYFVVNKGQESIVHRIGSFPAYWVVLSAPVVLGLMGFGVGSLWARVNSLIAQFTEENRTQGDEIQRTIAELEEANEEISAIIDNIHSAICTVDSSYIIGAQHNELIRTMFGKKEYSGHSIFENIFYILEQQKKDDLKEFMDFALANKTATRSMLNAALPFSEFVYIFNEEGVVQHKSIRMNVDRLAGSVTGKSRLMFVFEDVTAEEQLISDSEKKQSDFDHQYSIMVALFGNDRDVVGRFIKDLEVSLQGVKDAVGTLRQGETNKDILNGLLETIHTIKGEAFSLSFEGLANRAAEFEKYIKSIVSDTISIEHNLQIIGFLEKVLHEKTYFDRVISKLSAFVGDAVDEDTPEQENRIDQSVQKYLNEEVPAESEEEAVDLSILGKVLTSASETAAVENGKKVELKFSSSLGTLPDGKFRLVKESLIHLVRNSVAHGVETPEQRSGLGKPEAGVIRISVSREGEEIIIRYADDGRGLDVEKIRAKAIANGLISEERAVSVNPQRVMRFIFEDGFSTTDKADMVSGVGAGMAVVRKNVMEKLGGRLQFGNGQDAGVRFVITFPSEE